MSTWNRTIETHMMVAAGKRLAASVMLKKVAYYFPRKEIHLIASLKMFYQAGFWLLNIETLSS